MQRLLFSVGLGLTICAGLVVPAGAQRDRDAAVRPIAVESVDTPITAVPITDARPTDVRPDVEPPMETLRLACHGRMADNGRAGVACEWSKTTSRAAAGYALVRTDGDTRTTVFTTRDLATTVAVDTNIRIGVTYGYSVLVLDENGRTIGRGGPVRAGVKAPDPDPEIEVLTMHCEAADHVLAARCEWRTATSRAAVGYQLWRIVNRGEREQVWRGGLDHTAARDVLPDDTIVVRYAVLAVDKNGDVVGQSRPVALRFVDGPTDRTIDRAPVRAHRSGTHNPH
jgi:hypothetical protein